MSARGTEDFPDGPDSRSAEDWLARRDRGLSAEEFLEFQRWLAEKPDHAERFRRAARVWESLETAGRHPSIAALASQIESRAIERRAGRRLLHAAALFAACVAVAVAVRFWRGAGRVAQGNRAPAAVAALQKYHIVASTARPMRLPDSSLAELKGETRLSLAFVPAERRLRLLQGEAHFHVAHNPARPFIVQVGPIAVRAVGTAFDVRLGATTISVLVTQGVVELSVPATGSMPVPPRLQVGDRAAIGLAPRGATTVAIDHLDAQELDRELDWESNRLVFDRTPLDQMAEAFNRFNACKLVLADPALASRTLTGSFRADNLAGFVRLLQAGLDVEARPDGPNRLLLGPAATNP